MTCSPGTRSSIGPGRPGRIHRLRRNKTGRGVMSNNGRVMTTNERLARKIRREGKQPGSPYANKFVGLANGEIVVVADSLNDVSTRLRKIEADPARCYIVDVAADYDRVY